MSDSDALTLCAWALGKQFTEWPADAQTILAETYCANRKWMAEAEALMVERGLGEAYGEALCRAQLSPTDPFPRGWDNELLSLLDAAIANRATAAALKEAREALESVVSGILAFKTPDGVKEVASAALARIKEATDG